MIGLYIHDPGYWDIWSITRYWVMSIYYQGILKKYQAKLKYHSNLFSQTTSGQHNKDYIRLLAVPLFFVVKFRTGKIYSGQTISPPLNFTTKNRGNARSQRLYYRSHLLLSGYDQII